MSSSARRTGRLFRNAPEPEDIFVLGESRLLEFPAHAAMATAAEVVAAAEARAGRIVREAEEQAERMRTEANAAIDSVRSAAQSAGYEAGHREAADEVERLLAVVRVAASDGKAIRDSLAAQAAQVVATATGLAVRRITAEYYAADAERTVHICEEALRAASGQAVVSLRVNPAVVPAVQAALIDAAASARPDESVAIGGCIVDLRHGTLDATLDARLSMMDAALMRAAGGALA